MPRVTIQPAGIVLEVPAGRTVMEVAREQGYYWPTQCNMECRCSTCFFIVLEGAANLSPMGRAEKAALLEQRGRAALAPPVRLACQAQVQGEGQVVVRKRGVVPL